MDNVIYLDYAATTPVDPRVVRKMLVCLDSKNAFYGNASAPHHYGSLAQQIIEQARMQVASLINSDPNEIIWTSGATESNNLAIKGAANANGHYGKHIVTCYAEHKSVLEPMGFLEKNGFDVTYIKPNNLGIIEPQEVLKQLRDDTILVSIMHVNNETGIIQNIKSIADIVKSKNILFHVDAAQSAGKIAIDLKKIPLDFLSLSAHKIYGPKGIGALFVRKSSQNKISSLLQGGGQELNLRSGTLATHQIAGMGEAFLIASNEYKQDAIRIEQLKQFFWEELNKISRNSIFVNGGFEYSVPHILNISFTDYDNDFLLSALHTLAISKGSACTTFDMEASHVLQSMGFSWKRINSALRFSFGRFTTMTDIEKALEQIKKVLFS